MLLFCFVSFFAPFNLTCASVNPRPLKGRDSRNAEEPSPCAWCTAVAAALKKNNITKTQTPLTLATFNVVRNIWEELEGEPNHQAEKSLFEAEELRDLCACISDQISRLSVRRVVFLHFLEKQWDLGEMSTEEVVC